MKMPKVPDYFSRQAQIAMLGYVILAFAILIPVNIEKEEYNLTERVVSLIMMILPMIVSVYTINCLVVGSSTGGLPCNLLAWLNSGSILAWSVLVLILTLLIYANGSKPFAMKPNPVAMKPKPVAMKPNPVAMKPKPVAMKPKAVAMKPKPVAMKPNQNQKTSVPSGILSSDLASI